jgi:uncharacterized protein (DUF1810 family)
LLICLSEFLFNKSSNAARDTTRGRSRLPSGTQQSRFYRNVAHTHFAGCNYAAVVEIYSAHSRGSRAYLDLAAWAALGCKDHACAEAVKRLESRSSPPVFEALLSSLVHVLQGRNAEVLPLCTELELYEDPETALYLARHLAASGHLEPALDYLRRSVDGGLVLPETMANDPWLQPLVSHPVFAQSLERSRIQANRARQILSASTLPELAALATQRRAVAASES